MNRRFQRQQNKIVGDAAPGAFCVAFDAFFFGFGQPNCQRGVTQSLFTHNYHSPFPNSVGSGCRPKLWGPRKVARLFGERSNRPKSEAFAACGKTNKKGELRRADSRALCLPRTMSGKSVKPTRPQTPRIRVVSGASAVYPYPRRKRHKSPVNRRQGRKERLGRTDWGCTDSTVTNGTFVTGRKGILNFQQSGAVAAVAAKAHAEIGKAIFP